MVVAVTAKLTLVFAEEPPEVPVTVRFVVPAAMLAAVAMVSALVAFPLAGTVTCAGLKPHVTPVGAPEHERVTVPVKLVPLFGATVIVVVVLDPAEILAGLKALATRLNCASDAAQAFARFMTSGEPIPVTWS